MTLKSAVLQWFDYTHGYSPNAINLAAVRADLAAAEESSNHVDHVEALLTNITLLQIYLNNHLRDMTMLASNPPQNAVARRASVLCGRILDGETLTQEDVK
jgi:hypothetical protein